MIDGFKVGKYYRWIGSSKKRPGDWSPYGSMDFLLSGDWYKCIEVGFPSYRATFETGNPTEEREWSFLGNLHRFEESDLKIDKNKNLLLF